MRYFLFIITLFLCIPHMAQAELEGAALLEGFFPSDDYERLTCLDYLCYCFYGLDPDDTPEKILAPCTKPLHICVRKPALQDLVQLPPFDYTKTLIYKTRSKRYAEDEDAHG